MRLRLPDFSGTLEIDPDTWHARVYEYWRTRAEFNIDGYQENLCHYWRAVVIWAPLAWILTTNVTKRLPLWVVLLAAELVAIFTVSQLISTWLFLALFVQIVAFFVIPSFYSAPRSQRYYKRIGKTLQPLAQLRAVSAVVRAFQAAGKWFFCTGYLRVVYPWTVAITAILVVESIFEPHVMIIFALIIGAIVGFLVLAGCVVYVVDEVKTSLSFRRGGRTRPHHVRDGLRLAATVASAKKRRVCPRIVFRPRDAQ
jgi:hypothetical protein